MNRDLAFRRKVIYIGAIAVLLIPLYMLGSPSRRDKGDVIGGGYLARLRSHPDYRLAQRDLGEIDPASESMKLATLGLRGVAALPRPRTVLHRFLECRIERVFPRSLRPGAGALPQGRGAGAGGSRKRGGAWRHSLA